MKKLLLTSLVLLLTACATKRSNQAIQPAAVPVLGSIVKQEKGFWPKREAISLPNWGRVRVTVQNIPFNQTRYNAYLDAMRQQGRRPTIPYNDTLAVKPAFLRISLPDKVQLTEILNDKEHEAVREYLPYESNHALVTNLDLSLPGEEGAEVQFGEAVFLETDDLQNSYILVVNGNQEERYYFRNMEVFDFGLHSFCWEEGRSNPVLAHLVPHGSSCPQGTVKKQPGGNALKAYEKF